MLSVLGTAVPIFALIFIGWLTRKVGIFGPQATRELNRFVVYLALPALLFDIVATAQWHEIWRPDFIAAFGLGTIIVFAATLAVGHVRGKRLADTSIDGLNAAYANTAFLGFPLAQAFFGADGLTPTLIATILTVCMLFALALILMEASLQTERHPGRMIANTGKRIGRNPLVLAPTLGGAVLATGLSIPASVETFLDLLGGAASPCALVALGMFLGDARTGDASPWKATSVLTFVKLLVHPALVWTFAILFQLSGQSLHLAVLIAALPTGTGPFMAAEFYRREATITSTTILTSTILSLVTITLYLGLVA